jgi:hypothetical protein
MLQHYITVINSQTSDIYGGNLKTEIEFDAYADDIDKVLLDIRGIVAIVYNGSFKETMPSFLNSITQLQAARIFSIYDAMGVERPTLTIV